MTTGDPQEQYTQEEQIREALNAHWQASAVGDANAEHDIYEDDAICDYPQSGERILGRKNLQALRSHHPGKPSGFKVRRILGQGNLWITEYTITYQGKSSYTVSISNAAHAALAEATETSVQTAQEAGHGDRQAQRLLAKEQAAKAG